MTPAGIEQATFRFVAQDLNHCATAVPNLIIRIIIIIIITINTNNNNNNKVIVLIHNYMVLKRPEIGYMFRLIS